MFRIIASTLALLISLACASCDSPGHVYNPPGEGRIIYDPDRGLIRQAGELPENIENSEELFRAGMKLFNQGDFEAARARLKLYRERLFADGPRALEAVIWECIAMLERGRGQQSTWLADHVANAFHDEDPQAFAALGLKASDPSAKLTVLRLAQEIAKRFSRRTLNDNWALSQEIFVYYSAGLAVQTIPDTRGSEDAQADDLPRYRGLAADRSFFTMHSRHTRNLAWYALLAGQPRVAREAASFMERRTLNTAIRNPTLLILAEAALRLDLPVYAEQAYRDLAESADVRPLIQEQALYGEVRAIMAQSKGDEYDARVYERAEAKVDAYKAGFYVNHALGARMLEDFHRAKLELMQIRLIKLNEAVKTYERLFQEEAALAYQARADKLEQDIAALTLERFARLPGVKELEDAQ